MRRRLPLVRCQIYVESETLSSDRYFGGGAASDFVPGAGYRHHGRRAVALPVGAFDFGAQGARTQDISRNFGVAPFSGYFDWVCLSPKRQQPPLPEAFWRAHELKVIVEREADLQWAERNAEQVGRECKLFLQPEWSVSEEIMPLLVEYVKAHPAWNISIQTHKYMHIP